MNAMVILQKCGQSGKTFGIRVQQMEDGEWYETWAFPIDEARAGREGYTSMNIKSFLPQTAEYPGDLPDASFYGKQPLLNKGSFLLEQSPHGQHLPI